MARPPIPAPSSAAWVLRGSVGALRFSCKQQIVPISRETCWVTRASVGRQCGAIAGLTAGVMERGASGVGGGASCARQGCHGQDRAGPGAGRVSVQSGHCRLDQPGRTCNASTDATTSVHRHTNCEDQGSSSCCVEQSLTISGVRLTTACAVNLTDCCWLPTARCSLLPAACTQSDCIPQGGIS